MPRMGHELKLKLEQDTLVAACQCGKWRSTAPVPWSDGLIMAVAQLEREHAKHVDDLAHATTAALEQP